MEDKPAQGARVGSSPVAHPSSAYGDLDCRHVTPRTSWRTSSATHVPRRPSPSRTRQVHAERRMAPLLLRHSIAVSCPMKPLSPDSAFLIPPVTRSSSVLLSEHPVHANAAVSIRTDMRHIPADPKSAPL